MGLPAPYFNLQNDKGRRDLWREGEKALKNENAHEKVMEFNLPGDVECIDGTSLEEEHRERRTGYASGRGDDKLEE